MSQPKVTFSGRPYIEDWYNVEIPDLVVLDDLFEKLSESKPTLKDALREAGVHNHLAILDEALILADIARDKSGIHSLGLTDDEAGAISCYTFEAKKGIKSPYVIINEALAMTRNRASIKPVSKLIYLLLSGLRKLPHTELSKGQMLYRGIRRKVPTTRGEAHGHQFYAAGEIVTWRGFTSTTTKSVTAQSFIKGAPASTLFNIVCEDLWGYNIKDFSKYPNEDEILLEPEAKIKVNNVNDKGNFLEINATLQKFDHYILEKFIPVKDTGGRCSISQQIIPKCVWKECPGNVDNDKKYSIHEWSPRIATKINSGNYCTIIGDTPLPLNTVTSWGIKILKSKGNNGNGIYIGVAPFDINQNCNKSGWYIHCHDSTLHSGLPHDYKRVPYGPRKEIGNYVHTRDSVGVVMDTTNGELSFVLNGVNLGVAYKGIPLDKPLVPCVLIYHPKDSVKLDPYEVEENVDTSIPVPSNIITKNITWNSITLVWGLIAGTLFYQVEVDGNRSWEVTTANIFTKTGLLPDTEHTFKVRAVRGNSVSEWSDVVKGRTQKWECVWKECPDVDVNRKYSINKRNPRIATKNERGNRCGNEYCTIIGNTPLPFNKVTSWSIRILKSLNNNGAGINIGVAPSDINQNGDDNSIKCGWYFYCYESTLYSGPPHYYKDENYGPRKEKGEYIHTGDCVGVVMDSPKGRLSFVLNGVNLGVAYEGIPLDKPLVPCVLLFWGGDSVELDTSEIEFDKVNSAIPVPSLISVKRISCDSITLIWDPVAGASLYKVEMDGKKLLDVSKTNLFIKTGLLPDTEHAFRVRVVKGASVSEWSGVVKGRTQKKPTRYGGAWKECPPYVRENKKYSVDENNRKIVSNISEGDSLCIVIGNALLLLNQVTSWSIKILHSERNNGYGIDVGVAPFDIDQNRNDNYNKCGWYFYCYTSALFSGPPRYYRKNPYGPRKRNGRYVRTGDVVGVVMDTAKGELSFVLNGLNLGVAYSGIPLDKPLVPCVILMKKDDSVELVV